MKRYLLIGMIFLVGLTGYSQDCGDYIELLGKGITGMDEASIEVPGYENIEYIVAEAIYKADVEPSEVKFWTENEEVLALPEEVKVSGLLGSQYYVNAFYAEFTEPADMVHLDFLENISAFYSLVLYVHRQDGTVATISAGELYHVYQNEDDQLVTEIEVPVTDEPRDILIRYGITELNDDERLAKFAFEADGTIVEETIGTWNVEGGTDSYVIREAGFDDVPGPVDKITMTMLSENSGGDSYIAGIVLVDVPCFEDYESDVLCSYTQGYYGNEGGKTCDGKTTRELLEMLLADELVMGGNGNSFTIGAGAVDCVLDILPGGGPSKVLSGEAACDDPGSYQTNKQGRLRNSLLAQGITLALNVRYSPGLLDFPVDGEPFTAMVAEDCMDPMSAGVPWTAKSYTFCQEVADKLGENGTISDLLDLVNMALQGEDIEPLSLSQVADAAVKVNEAFDECVVIKGYNVTEEQEREEVVEDGGDGGDGGEFEGGDGEEPGGDQEEKTESGAKGVTAIDSDHTGEVLGIYPNPVLDFFYLNIPSEVMHVSYAGIYNMTGVMLKRIDNIEPGVDQVLEIDVSGLMSGFYFVRIDTGSGSIIKRFGIR